MSSDHYKNTLQVTKQKDAANLSEIPKTSRFSLEHEAVQCSLHARMLFETAVLVALFHSEHTHLLYEPQHA